MQQNLFDNQSPAAEKQESYGKQQKRAFTREKKYQRMKLESQRLQRQWTNLKPKREAEAEAERDRRDQLNAADPITVVLVACASLKADSARPAKELYSSVWFKKARTFAESNGDAWFILSSRHNLIAPETVIEPYNETLNGKRKAEREAWAQRTASSLRDRIPPKSRIIILAGENYRADLIPLLVDRYFIEVPMRGLGILQQLAFLKAANNER